MKINMYISDLFFNTDHGDAFSHDDLNKRLVLEVTARDFIDSIQGLGIDCPSVKDLVQDCISRS